MTTYNSSNSTSLYGNTNPVPNTTDDVFIRGDLTVGGTITGLGDMTIVGLTEVGDLVVNGNIQLGQITLHGSPTAPTSNDGTGFGIKFNYWNDAAASAKQGFIGFNQIKQDFVFYRECNIVGDVVTGSTGSITANNINVDGNADTAATITLNSNDDAVSRDAFIKVKRAGTDRAEIKWDSGLGRWQTSLNGISYVNIPVQNLDITGTPKFDTTTQNDVYFGTGVVPIAKMVSGQVTATGAYLDFPIDSYPTLTNRTTKVWIECTLGTRRHALEVTLMSGYGSISDVLQMVTGEIYNDVPLFYVSSQIILGTQYIYVSKYGAAPSGTATFRFIRTSFD